MERSDEARLLLSDVEGCDDGWSDDGWRTARDDGRLSTALLIDH